jgi:hypothetical protein
MALAAKKNPIKFCEIGFYKSSDTTNDLISNLNFILNGHQLPHVHLHNCVLNVHKTTGFEASYSDCTHCSFYHYCNRFGVEISINYFTHFHSTQCRFLQLPEARAGRSM